MYMILCCTATKIGFSLGNRSPRYFPTNTAFIGCIGQCVPAELARSRSKIVLTYCRRGLGICTARIFISFSFTKQRPHSAISLSHLPHPASLYLSWAFCIYTSGGLKPIHFSPARMGRNPRMLMTLKNFCFKKNNIHARWKQLSNFLSALNCVQPN